MSARRLFLAVLALALAAPPPAWGEPPPPPKVFTFAAGYRLDQPAPHNVVELGVVADCAGGRCLSVQRFDSASLLPRVPTSYRHAMRAPYGKEDCTNDPVSTVRSSDSEQGKALLREGGGGFSVEAAGLRYRWTVDPGVASGFTLAGVTRLADGAELGQPVGFGFGSEAELKGTIRASQLAALYKGEIYHKTAQARADGPWQHAPSSIDFRVYAEAAHGEVLTRSLAGDAAIVRQYRQPMWVNSSVVLARGAGAVAPLVQEYGHDFNMDGCFDESGHNKLLLPVGAGDVSALVYIEYTTDAKRGFPMLSVGRYYR